MPKALKGKPVTACAPRIWKKFNKVEQKIWTEIFKKYLWEIDTLDLSVKDDLGRPAQDVLAHNFACEAIWAMQTHLPKSK